jgi:hypothetical protein
MPCFPFSDNKCITRVVRAGAGNAPHHCAQQQQPFLHQRENFMAMLCHRVQDFQGKVAVGHVDTGKKRVPRGWFPCVLNDVISPVSLSLLSFVYFGSLFK